MRINTNNVLEALNLLMAVLSLAVIGVSAWLATRVRADCLSFLHWPFIVVGLLIFCVSVLGFVASSRRKKALLLVYLVLLVLIILLFLAFTLFAVIVTAQHSDGRPVAGASFHEYTTADFSEWLQKRVNEPNWGSIHTCLARGHLCASLDEKYETLEELYAADLSPTQVGCCKPPSVCGFAFESATTWIRRGRRASSSDCSLWSNDATQLCFACDSCRAGEMRAVRRHWLNVANVSLVALVLLFILLILTCGALCCVKDNAIPDYPKKHPTSPNI